MPERQVSFTFGELVEQGVLEIGDGYRAKLEELGGSGPIFLRAGLLTEDSINWTKAERFHAELIPKVRSKFGYPNDTVVTTKGNSVGRTAYIPSNAPPFVYSPHLSYWRSIDPTRLVSGFLRYWSRSAEFTKQLNAMANSTDMAPYLSLVDQRRLRISLPKISVQNAAVALLGALDDKIAVNDKVVKSAHELSREHFRAAASRHDAQGTETASIVELLSRGITPNYTEDDSQLRVLNQKCIRDGHVSFAPSRRTIAQKVPEKKILRPHDVLVNSTGVGTLGRVARWTKTDPCTVDSHVTIVRFNPAKIDPVCAGFGMLEAQTDIEALGEGSTGQTELSRTQLAALQLVLPSRDQAVQLRPKLDALEECTNAALEESLVLVKLRNTLLPKLISGEIRVREVERIVEEVT